MVGGIGILVYVGISYEQARQAAATPHQWSASEKSKGKILALALAKHRTITVPKRLRRQHIAPGSEPAVRIVIPKIGVNAPVLQTPPVNGIWNVADWAVGHLSTTPNPGAPGNDALSAHDDIKGEIFKRLGELHPGDPIELYTQHAVYTYVVTGQQTVDPSNTSVLDPTPGSVITLISCTPYWVDTERLVVQAMLKSQAAV